jgi:antitoxin component YwqK of YwqJK toxin-antitoxin module
MNAKFLQFLFLIFFVSQFVWGGESLHEKLGLDKYNKTDREFYKYRESSFYEKYLNKETGEVVYEIGYDTFESKTAVELIPYKNGFKHGDYIVWFSDGSLKKKISYDSGKLHGLYQEWTTEGKLIAESVFILGTGTIKRKSENDNILEIINYVDNKKFGLQMSFYKTGEIKSFYYANDNSKIWFAVSYHKNGSVSYIAKHNESGERFGPVYRITLDGELAEVRYFIKGVEVSKKLYTEKSVLIEDLPVVKNESSYLSSMLESILFVHAYYSNVK